MENKLFVLNTDYSEEELKFIKENDCKIISEIRLSRVNFSEYEMPKRMLNYCGTYIAEITDDEDNRSVWAVLTKYKGVYHFPAYFESLEVLAENL